MANKTDKLLPFTNDFIFSLVMQSSKICKELLERILPEIQFSDIKLDTTKHISSPNDLLNIETQKTMKFGSDAHGIRFDAYVKTEDIWAEIEMQTYSKEDIGKRSRYYHSNMDIDFLEAGRPYKDLKKSYVIFICTFDFNKADEPMYHFQNYDIDTNTYLNDGSHTIILNTSCPLEKVPDRLKPLYAYINDSQKCDDAFIQELDSYVRKYNSPEWRKAQMTLEHLMKQSEDRMARLAQILLEANRNDDLLRATQDTEYRKKLFEEFDLL